MTSAELKTMRESLGLTAQWLADVSGVQLRTVQYWEVDRAVPDEVAKRLIDLDARFSEMARNVVSLTGQLHEASGTKPENVKLYRFRNEQDLWRDRPDMQGLPVTCYAAMLNRCRLALEEEGYKVRILYKH